MMLPYISNSRRWEMLFRSVRWRLQLWHALILMGVIVLLCMLAHRLAITDRSERIDRELESFERSFMRRFWEMPSDNPKDGLPPSTAQIRERFLAIGSASQFPLEMKDLFDPAATDSTYLVFWDGEGNGLFRSANAPEDLTFPPPPDPDRGRPARVRGHFRELIRGGPRGFRGIVGRDISPDRAELGRLAWQITGSGTLLWLLGLIGGWWLAGRVIQPINAISRTASRIARGNVSERIEIPRTGDELARLGHVLNDTFDRLETAIHRQRQFTADASHELRTPLTVILSETSRGLKRDRDPAEYRDILSNCQHAAVRMRSLVESLLILARQDGEPAVVSREPCDLAAIVTESLRLLQPLADQRDIGIRTDLAPATCSGEARSLSMLAVNLISNAIDHQNPGGTVSIRLTARDGEAVLEVSDTGPGIATEHLPRLFDRFYRVDPARGASGGHSGLGLAIVKAIVENHHGTIDVQSTPGHGSTFRVLLPA